MSKSSREVKEPTFCISSHALLRMFIFVFSHGRSYSLLLPVLRNARLAARSSSVRTGTGKGPGRSGLTKRRAVLGGVGGVEPLSTSEAEGEGNEADEGAGVRMSAAKEGESVSGRGGAVYVEAEVDARRLEEGPAGAGSR